MSVAIVTGSAGLIGSEAVRFLARKGYAVVGIDNDMRRCFFGDEASTAWNRQQLERTVPGYRHHAVDIRDADGVEAIFRSYGADVGIIIHAAAQPSHDWAARDPRTDFTVNAVGTLVLLDAARRFCPRATFIFTSTNKVYGDNPNRLPFVEIESRWEVEPAHPYAAHGIDEAMSVDQCKHSFFGASKLAADALVQEYGREFGMNTGVFRGGCFTGGSHAGTELHGFLSYLMRCCVEGRRYKIFGYQGKQVRDNIHAYDLVNMFWHFHQDPRPGEVYNAGGSRHSNCSVREAIELCQRISGRSLDCEYVEQGRSGDHIWYISDVRKFRRHYPEWNYRYDLDAIVSEIHEQWRRRSTMAA